MFILCISQGECVKVSYICLQFCCYLQMLFSSHNWELIGNLVFSCDSKSDKLFSVFIEVSLPPRSSYRNNIKCYSLPVR